MSILLKKVGILLLTGLISISLIAGANASTRPKSKGEPKVKRSRVELGKNWERSGKITVQEATPSPKKNLFVKPAPAQNQVPEEQLPQDPDNVAASDVVDE